MTMINTWTLSLMVSFLGITARAALMPLENGVPKPLITLRDDFHTKSRASTPLPVDYPQLERTMWKYGMDVLKQYCDSGKPQHQSNPQKKSKVVRACGKVKDIFTSTFPSLGYDHTVNNDFPDNSRLNRYLEKMGSTADRQAIIDQLQMAIVYVGYQEMKQFCDPRAHPDWFNNDDNQFACTLTEMRAQSVQKGDWN